MAIKITNDGVDFESIDVIRAFVVIVFWAFIGVNIYGTCVNTQSIAEHFKKEDRTHTIQILKDDCIKKCPRNVVMYGTKPVSVPYNLDWDDVHNQCVARCEAEATEETNSVWR